MILEAAFIVNRDEHVQDEINSSREILCEPRTEEELLRRRRDGGLCRLMSR
jgi:hypothetical protein